MRRCSIGQLLTVGSWAASGAGGPWLCATALAGGLPLSGAVTGDARKRHAGVCLSDRVASVFSAGGGVARRVVRSLTPPPAHAERNAHLTGISFGQSGPCFTREARKARRTSDPRRVCRRRLGRRRRVRRRGLGRR